jgi:hypothetical protein
LAEPVTIAYVSKVGEAVSLAAAAGVAPGDVDELIDEGDTTLDALQDRVWAGEVKRVLLPSLTILGPDVMAQEMILSGWVERGVGVFSQAEPDLGSGDVDRRRARAALGEIEDYGKVPWVP